MKQVINVLYRKACGRITGRKEKTVHCFRTPHKRFDRNHSSQTYCKQKKSP